MTIRREILVNDATAVLDGSIDGSQTTLDVLDGSVFPSTGDFRVRVEDEIMLVTARATNTLTIVRGIEGTSGASHADALDVTAIVTQGSLQRYARDNDDLFDSGRPPLGRIVDGNGDVLTSADFTWFNQDSSSVADRNGTIVLTRPLQGGGEHASGMSKAAPSTPYTIVCGLRPNYVCGGAYVTGLVFRQAGTGKFTTCRWLEVGNGSPGIRITHYTSPTSVDSSPTLLVATNFCGIIWMRGTDNGTNIIFEVSNDGIDWVQVYSASRTIFMSGGPDEVGFYLDAVSSADDSYTTLVHWNEDP